MTIEKVYDDHVDKVYKFFYIQCLDKPTAEDLTSKTFMTLLKKMQDADVIIEDHKKYTYGVMRNVWLAHLREKYRRNEHAVEEIDDFSGYVDKHVDEFEAKDINERVRSLVELLPDMQQQILTLRIYQQKSIKETAAELGKNTNYVKVNQRRALAKLRELTSGAEHLFLKGESHG